jgi:hypothetical protein
MIKVIYGEKGMGKTKILIDTANALVTDGKGDVVFIDDSNEIMYNLKHEIRFINIADFPELCQKGFFGFLCGILSQNYDIEGIFIDGLNYILKQKASEVEQFFSDLALISDKSGVKFCMTINGKSNDLPEFMKQYID